MDPQVIADTALYLNSDLAAKVTGVTIPVDAGHSSSPRITTPRPLIGAGRDRSSVPLRFAEPAPAMTM